jgi:hypothetical protein
VQWDLLGSTPYVTVHNYYDDFYAKPNLDLKDVFQKFDFDSVTPATLASFPYVITTRGAYASGPPPWLHPVQVTPDFVLWERGEATVPSRRQVLGEGAAPGRVLRYVFGHNGGDAAVFADKPVTGSSWDGGPTVEDGGPVSQTFDLPAGTWQVSIQYDATRPLELTGPNYRATLSANLDYRGTTPFYAAGAIDVQGSSPVTISANVQRPPLAGRLMGANSVAHLGTLAFTPASGEETVPLRDAIGRYVDWYSRR